MGVRSESLTEAQLEQRRAAARAKADKGDPAQELRLAELLRAAEASTTPDVDPGFAEATFLAVVRKCSVTSGGGWAVLLEVPHGDQDAFYPVAKATEIELVFHVVRKPTSRGRRRNGKAPAAAPAAPAAATA